MGTKVRIKKGEVEYEFDDNIELVNKTLYELTALALNDIGDVMWRNMLLKLKSNHPHLKSKGTYVGKTFQKWVRKKECDLQVGTGKWKYSYTGEGQGKWYGERQEVGSPGKIRGGGSASTPKEGIIENTVMEHIDDIKKITEHWLSQMSDEKPNSDTSSISDEEAGGED